MLYDLSIGWSPATPAADLRDTLAMSAELGYDVVALDHLYTAVPSSITNPIPDSLLSSLSSFSSSSSSSAPPRRFPRILRRATIVISDTTVNHRLSAVAAAYDLVAVRPTTEKAFQAACLHMAEPALISLDLTSHFPFYFKHRAAMAAVRRGVFFEVCYGQVVRGSGGGSGSGSGSGGDTMTDRTPTKGSARARALFVANLAGLLRATRGRGIVVSSGAASALDLRGPADVVNLLAVWGLAPDRGTEAFGGLARSVVANEGARRRGFRGIVDIVQTAGPAEAGEAGETGQGQKESAGQKRRAETHGGGRGKKADERQSKKQKRPGQQVQ